MRKNTLFQVGGCALLLIIGAQTYSAKAVYPNANVIEKHWWNNLKVFQETFEALSQNVERLSLWSAVFPDGFTKQNGDLYTIKTANDLLFHTASDLNELSCDTELKKIVKILGSQEFLQKILSGEVIRSVFNHAVSGEGYKTKIEFIPHFTNDFFGNECWLQMVIRQYLDDIPVFQCDFMFGFEKGKNRTVLKNYKTIYCVQNQGLAEVKFLKKKWNILKKTEK